MGGEVVSKRLEFALEVASIFNDPIVLKQCVEPTLRGFVCHTKNIDDILQYFLISILKNCGNILESLHTVSDGFNLDYYGYDAYKNRILFSFSSLIELCLLFKDEEIIKFIDTTSMRKVKRIFLKFEGLDVFEKSSRFIQKLMKN